MTYYASFDATGSAVKESFALTDVKNLATTADFSTVTGKKITALADTDLTSANLDAFMTGLNTVKTSVDLAASQLGAFSNRLQGQQDFIQKLSDIKEAAVGKLVNADLESEAAKLGALRFASSSPTRPLR